MIVVLAIVGMPMVLITVTLAVDGVLKRHPSRDDVWQLPKVSSVSLAAQRP